MNILLAEYTVHNEPALAPEGRAMLQVLTDSFTRIGAKVHSPKPGKDFGEEIARLGATCDEGLVIAPDHLLARYTKILEDNTRNIGCNSFSIAVCANKQRAGHILTSHGIDVPPELTEGTRIIKPVQGCGAQQIRLADEEPGKGEFGQQYIEGETLSISLVGSRVVGETCLYYTGSGPLFLSINHQDIKLNENGILSYEGGETPYNHPRQQEIYEIASKALTILGCQGYIGIDMIVTSDKIFIVDVNPRPTTSIIGIAACMQEEIGQVILDASYGKAPEKVTMIGTARFNSDGTVTYDRN